MTADILRFLNDFDTNLLLFLNGFHSEFWDYFMSTFTGKLIWAPMYATILYVLVKNYHWKNVLACTVMIALTITFADQMCNSIIRPIVERLRPSDINSPIADLVHIVNGKRGGGYGFPSCHASNSLGLAICVILLFRNKNLSLFITTWALINAYTRLYLGLHYPGDLIVGGILGGLGAWGLYELLRRSTFYTRKEMKQTSIIIYAGIATTLFIVIYSVIKCFI